LRRTDVVDGTSEIGVVEEIEEIGAGVVAQFREVILAPVDA
jgi:hypothetical protein